MSFISPRACDARGAPGDGSAGTRRARPLVGGAVPRREESPHEAPVAVARGRVGPDVAGIGLRRRGGPGEPARRRRSAGHPLGGHRIHPRRRRRRPARRGPPDPRLRRRRRRRRHGGLQLLLRHRGPHRPGDLHHRHRLDRNGLRAGGHGPRDALPHRPGPGRHRHPRRRPAHPGRRRRVRLHRPGALRPRGGPAPRRDRVAAHHPDRRRRRLVDPRRHRPDAGRGRPGRPDLGQRRLQHATGARRRSPSSRSRSAR